MVSSRVRSHGIPTTNTLWAHDVPHLRRRPWNPEPWLLTSESGAMADEWFAGDNFDDCFLEWCDPLLDVDMANWKIIIYDGWSKSKWTIFSSHVSHCQRVIMKPNSFDHWKCFLIWIAQDAGTLNIETTSEWLNHIKPVGCWIWGICLNMILCCSYR